MQQEQTAHAHRALIPYIPPLFLCTLIFIVGIVWQAHNSNPVTLAFLATILAIASLAPQYQKQWRFLTPWVVAAFSIGALRNTLHEYQYLQESEQLCNKKIELRGTIVSRETTNKQYVTCLTIALDSPTQPLVKLYCMQPVRCEYGDSIALKNVFLKPPTYSKNSVNNLPPAISVASKRSSLSIFFKKQSIVATGYIGKQQPFVIKAKPPTTRSWIHTRRDQLLKRFELILSPRTFMLVSSIFLGYKTVKNKMSDLLYEQFQWWGISHYLARSGLHLVMFVIILHMLCMFFPIPFIIRQIFVTGSIATYMLFSWSSVSFIRSLLMIFCYLLCSIFKMQQHGLHTISIACCAILLYNPTFLFALDFQLSFGLTLALIVLHWAQLRKKQTAFTSP